MLAIRLVPFYSDFFHNFPFSYGNWSDQVQSNKILHTETFWYSLPLSEVKTFPLSLHFILSFDFYLGDQEKICVENWSYE